MKKNKIFNNVMILLSFSGMNLILYGVFNFEIAILIALGFLTGHLVNQLYDLKNR